MKKLLFILAILLSSCSYWTGVNPPKEHENHNYTSNPFIQDTITLNWDCNLNDSISIECEKGEWMENEFMIPMSSKFRINAHVPGYYIDWINFDKSVSAVIIILAKTETYYQYWTVDTVHLKEFTITLIKDHK